MNKDYEKDLEILRKGGFDIDKAIREIVGEKKKKQDKLDLEAEFPTVNDIMTSELVQKANALEDVYGREYGRRMRLIGLEEDEIKQVYELEKRILDVEQMKEGRQKPWVQGQFIKMDTTIKKMPAIGDMTLSELILITDEASAAYWMMHEILPQEAWYAVCLAACEGKGEYANAFLERAKKLGWKTEQANAYVANESKLLMRLKWGKNKDPEWTPETTDLQQYKS